MTKSLFRIFQYSLNALLLTLSIFVSAGELEEVIVTAQKREQSMQDIGVSITAFSGEQLQQGHYTNATELSEQTPGLTFTASGGDGGAATFNLRGVGQSDFAEHQESPVALYFDEAYVSAMSGLTFQLFDLERVEVLRGPQGTLFGRNATGGLAHFITRKPSEEFEGYGELTGGEYGQVKFEGAMGGPITERISGRLSVAVHDRKGYVENRIGEDGGELTNYAGRGQLLIEASDDLEILLKLQVATQEGSEPRGDLRATAPTGADGTGVFINADNTYWSDLLGTPSCPGCDAFGYREPDDDPFTGSYNANGFLNYESHGAYARITWDINEQLSLTSISDYSFLGKDYIEDSDFSPNDVFTAYPETDVTQFSQEVRLNGETDQARWVAGFYYLDIDTNARSGINFGTAVAVLGVPAFSILNDWETNTTSWAVFGQGEYDISEDWTFLLGLRYTDDNKKHDFTTLVPAFFGATPLNDFSRTTVGDLAEIDLDNNLSGKFEINWRPAEDMLLYAFVSLGTKGGGFNAPLDGAIDAGGLAPALFGFGEEVLTEYAVGIKTDLFNQLLRLNMELFYYDYDDYQAFALRGLTSTVFNTDGEIKGFDAELLSSPLEGLTLQLGVSVVDAEAELPLTNGQVVDREMPFSADLGINGLVRYEWPMLSGIMGTQFDFNYESEKFFELNNNAIATEGSYWIGNLSLSYTTSDEKWGMSVFVKNVTDEEYRLSAFDLSAFGGLSQNWLGKPRWFGGSVRYDW